MAWVLFDSINLDDKNWQYSIYDIPPSTQAIKITQTARLGATQVPPENLKGLRGLFALYENIFGIINFDSFKPIYPSNDANIIRVINLTFATPRIATRITTDRWLFKYDLNWNLIFSYWDEPIIDNPLNNQEWSVIIQ